MTDVTSTPQPTVKKSGLSLTTVLIGTTILIVIAGAVGFALNRHITHKITQKFKIADDGWINYRRKTNLRNTCSKDVTPKIEAEPVVVHDTDPNFTPLDALVKAA